MISEVVLTPSIPVEAVPDPAGPVSAEWREHLTFQRAETRDLRAVNNRLAHELALARRLLASFLPADSGAELWPTVTAAVRLPDDRFDDGEADLRFAVDDVDRGRAHTRLRGWAFAPALADCAASTVTLLFVPAPAGGVTSAGTHAVPTEAQVRPDVAAAFADLRPAPANLDRTGFVATVFHPSLAPGEYELFLHVARPGGGAARRPAGLRLGF